MCRELADLGMQLARAAAQRALRDQEAPQAAAGPAARPAARPRPKTPDPTLAFARLSRELRQLMLLETRLAAVPKPAARAARATRAPRAATPPGFTQPAFTQPAFTQSGATPPAAEQTPIPAADLPDERRTILRRAVAGLTVGHPHRVSLRRIIAVRIDDELAADPGHRNPAANILLTLSRELGLAVERVKIPPPTEWAPPITPCCTDPPRLRA